MGKGWLGAPLIKKDLRKVQKKKKKRAIRASLTVFGPGTRLRVPVGVQGAKSLEALVFFNAETISNPNLHVRLLLV